MSVLQNIVNLFWERNVAGDHWYSELTEAEGFGIKGSNLYIAQNHPILTPAMLFVCKLFSQATFKMVNAKTGKVSNEHPLLDLLNTPNSMQTKMDLLESLLFMQIANGVAVIHKKAIIGLPDDIQEFVLLDYCKLKFPDNANFKQGNFKCVYMEGTEEEVTVEYKDLIFFYDMPSGLKNNPTKVDSRIDGLRQTLINTHDSLVAKNIILKTNGKELLSGNKSGFPMSDDEKRDAQRLFNNKYGLSKTRSRSLVTSADVTWRSLHIALRDLGLDESVKVDGNIIYTALHIPKDIISLEAKKTTYNNFKESITSYIQNEIQSSIDAFCEVINKSSNDKKWKLVGSYDHLPVMQFIKKEKYEAQKIRGEALVALLNAGVPEEIALKELGFDPTVKLEPRVQSGTPQASDTTPTTT
jgi:Phage portal protein